MGCPTAIDREDALPKDSWTRRAGRVLGLVLLFVSSAAFAEDRVAKARAAKAERIRQLFQQAQVAYPPAELYLRAFKTEGELELWAGDKGKPLVKVKTYPICASSGGLGPKRQQGDLQVPEGFYWIRDFNPRSNFHLSMGLDYPNASDRVRGVKGNLGGDIYVHGSCVTVGCIPIEDDAIEEVYLVALEMRNRGRRIPVHVFPRRMDAPGMDWLKERAGTDAALLDFWRELAPGYTSFEQSRRPPTFSVDPKTGRYQVRAGR
ncbi:MAG TPA: L,D-transpeptidase family protein [Myxococcaceae bacterium]|nr:L,D-transpeptidase family protein [Myxococcaceae bacterium]